MGNKDIQTAARIINNGGLVAFPTETVYGLGANALNPIAVAKIFAIKERPSIDPLIVHIASFDDLKILANQTTDLAEKLAEKFWPGPLTIVLPKSRIVPDIVTSGLPTVGIRMPANEIAANLFSSLHAMEDDEQIKQIFIQPVIEEGLGIAIMDRIKKAVFKYDTNK